MNENDRRGEAVVLSVVDPVPGRGLLQSAEIGDDVLQILIRQ